MNRSLVVVADRRRRSRPAAGIGFAFAAAVAVVGLATASVEAAAAGANPTAVRRRTSSYDRTNEATTTDNENENELLEYTTILGNDDDVRGRYAVRFDRCLGDAANTRGGSTTSSRFPKNNATNNNNNNNNNNRRSVVFKVCPIIEDKEDGVAILQLQDYLAERDYVLDLETYLQEAATYYRTKHETMCGVCYDDCPVWGNDDDYDAGDWLERMGNNNDRLLQNTNNNNNNNNQTYVYHESNTGASDFNVDCDTCYEECQNDYIHPLVFSSCTIVYHDNDDDDAPLFAGPVCTADSNGSSTIEIGFFRDEDCTVPALDRRDAGDYLLVDGNNDDGFSAMKLSHAILQQVSDPDQCMSCEEDFVPCELLLGEARNFLLGDTDSSENENNSNSNDNSNDNGGGGGAKIPSSSSGEFASTAAADGRNLVVALAFLAGAAVLVTLLLLFVKKKLG